MKAEYSKLISSLKSKKFAPIYFLHGEENFFIDDIAEFIESHALSESEKSFNQQVLYGKEIDANTIKNAAMRYPLMSPYQVLIIKEAQQIKKWDELEVYFEKPVDTTILVICYKFGKFDKRTKAYKALEKGPAVLFESKTLEESKVPEWIHQYLETRQRKIKKQAADILTEYLGNDLEKIANAMDKIINTSDENKVIDEKDIEQNVGISREYNIFELQKAIINKDMLAFSKIVNYMATHTKDHPLPMAIGFFYGFFSKVTAIQLKRTPAKDLGINEFFFKDYQKAAANYPNKGKYIMSLLQDYDLRFKGVNDTGTDDGELFKELFYKIIYA